MTVIDENPSLDIMGGLQQDQLDPPVAPVSAPSALNSVLGDKAPLDFVPFSLNSVVKHCIVHCRFIHSRLQN